MVTRTKWESNYNISTQQILNDKCLQKSVWKYYRRQQQQNWWRWKLIAVKCGNDDDLNV